MHEHISYTGEAVSKRDKHNCAKHGVFPAKGDVVDVCNDYYEGVFYQPV
jgi:hypothetical protein